MRTVPLFQLPVVLFPGALLPLHIFEPRYRAMLSDCVEGDHLFGVVPGNSETEVPALGAIGCVARVRAVQPLPDGRSNIVVSGEDRFELRRLVPSQKAYPIGEIEDLEDVPDVQVPRPDELATLRTLGVRYAEALATLNDVEREPEFTDEPGTMTFQIASLLEWELPIKRHFLAIRSATERVTRLLHALPTLLGSLEGRAQVHRRASLNGKGGSPPPMTEDPL